MILFSALALAAPFGEIPLQGVASGTSGLPLDGDRAVTFRLFDAPSGGSLLREEMITVSFARGGFATVLGGGATFDLALFAQHPSVWMEMQVGDDVPSARVAVATTPYAAFSAFAGDAATLGGSPPEAFIPWTGGPGIPWDRIDPGSAVTATELGFLAGVSSALQAQLDATAPSASPTFTGSLTLPGAGSWSDTGVVGIGISTPRAGYRASVGSPGLWVDATSGSNGLQVERASNLYINLNIDSTRGFVSTASSQPLVFQQGASEVMRLHSNGNVGVSTANPSSTLDVNGSLATAVSVVTGNTTLGAAHSVVLANSASNLTVTLPSAAGITGRSYTIKNISTGKVTVAAVSSQVIDDVANYTLGSRWEFLHVVSNGSGWTILEGGTYPRVHASRSGSSMPNTAPGGQFLLNGTLEDTHGAYDGASSQFTAPVSGTYAVHFMLHDNGSSGQFCPRANVSGTSANRRAFQVLSSNHVVGSDHVRLSAGQTLRYFNDCGSTFVAHPDTSGQFVWMTIQRVQ
jgi:hypothetical protein